jgi:hypothetical protein
MSGYDPETGWVSFTVSRWRRYFRGSATLDSDMEPIVFARLKNAGIDYYLGSAGTLFARCNTATLWTILSGKPATFGFEEPPARPSTQWLSVTDIGYALTVPPLPPTGVLKLLRQAGLLERRDGEDHPTARAEGLYLDREFIPSSRFAGKGKPKTTQRVWAYAALELLRDMEWDAPQPKSTTTPAVR